MLVKILMSLLFGILLIIEMFVETIKVDTTTIILAVLIFSPWIIQYIKSLEINGIGKFELYDKETKKKLEAKAENVVADKLTECEYKKYSFYRLKDDDTKLAMAALRIEIEEQLRKIAEKNQISTSQTGLIKLAKQLFEAEYLDRNEMAIIQDLSNILNKAVHSQLKDYDSYGWIFAVGIKLMESLHNKSKES